MKKNILALTVVLIFAGLVGLVSKQSNAWYGGGPYGYGYHDGSGAALGAGLAVGTIGGLAIGSAAASGGSRKRRRLEEENISLDEQNRRLQEENDRLKRQRID